MSCRPGVSAEQLAAAAKRKAAIAAARDKVVRAAVAYRTRKSQPDLLLDDLEYAVDFLMDLEAE